ncbi:hypothetical protein PHLCEN_2v7084 [Hermanssonia centrifuga]|uniref:AB hydrolase-1 domain-containing protein n=1 Tax=Hermanssonia centrifuga TaxID=98765 RepID=A0A2R6NXH8_9APHY|nr:hypothetical protein PHLCEN_2v7084 [Hermanssonia centrifuga]
MQGGAVAAAFSSMFPHLVNDGVVFIAAAGMMDLPKPQRSRSPNEALMRLTEQKQSQNCIAALGPHPTRASLPNLQAAYLPGFEEASASSSREGILSEVHWAYEALGKSTDKRFLIFHGTGDFVVPYDHALKIKNFIPQAELITIKTSSHALVLEPGVWEDVTRRIIAFFP